MRFPKALILERTARLVAFVMLITASIAVSANSGGRATVANSGNTGAPGESVVCGTCHATSTAFGDISAQMDVIDGLGMPATLLIPDQVYTITITVLHTGAPAGFGFQATVLDQDNRSVGTLSNPSSNTQFAQTTGADGRAYAEHNGVSPSNTFSFDWTAPTGTGVITFYVTATAVNGNGATSGDGGGFGQSSSARLRSLLLFDQRQPFLDQTEAGIASAPYAEINDPPEPFVSGQIAFTAGPMSSLFFADWQGADFPQDNDVELAINGNEDLDVESTVGPVFSMGLDFDDIGGGTTPSTFTVTGTDDDEFVFEFSFDTPDPARSFLGVWSTVAFDALSIRETSTANENEFFGTVFTGQTRLPDLPFADGFEDL